MTSGCLVTGVAGFVGSHLVERLLALGHAVVGIDNFASGHRENMASFFDHPDFSFYERSIVEPGLLAALHRDHPQIQCCFHLAAIVSVPYSVAHPEETMEVNFHATCALLEEAARLQYSALVFAGSAAEYGADVRLPLQEEYATEATQHLSPYGRAKFLSSTVVSASRQPHGVALRCFNIYGPRQDPSSPYSGVISRFIEAGCRNQPLTIFGDGQQTRDFVYVADVVEAYLQAAGLPGGFGLSPALQGIYNVASGQKTSILKLAQHIRGLTGNEQDLAFLPERPGDIRHSWAAISKLQHATEWHPQFALADGLKQTLDWARTSGDQ
jgi:UDP-glucose 4-epimerase